MSDKTSIQISKEMKARLDKLAAGKGDTYEQIIARLIAQVREEKVGKAK